MAIDLTTAEGVRELMLSSRNPDEWSANVAAVKAANGDRYPAFWGETIIVSGLTRRVAESWGRPDALGLKVSIIG